jgi:hypothetical protein
MGTAAFFLSCGVATLGPQALATLRGTPTSVDHSAAGVGVVELVSPVDRNTSIMSGPNSGWSPRHEPVPQEQWLRGTVGRCGPNGGTRWGW